jgi:teichuronic acid biosynthesis glycosyltransferase TuaC
MHALIVTNMYPSPERPALGSFVRDQVDALRRTGTAQVEVFAFAPGGAGAYVRGARALRRAYGHVRFDVVHAHFGLSLWPALSARAGVRAVTLHGTDLTDPTSRAVTLAGLRLMDLVGVVSEPLSARVPRWASGGRTAVLPCGVALDRFVRIPRAEARSALGLDPEGRYLLFPSDPARPEKRIEAARQVAQRTGARLLTLGAVTPEDVPLWVNSANAVLIPSEREGFGLAVLEALACDVPVLATPVGIAPEALAGVPGTLCAPFDVETWTAATRPHVEQPDPRIEGRAAAEPFSSDAMALRLLDAWRSLLDASTGD